MASDRERNDRRGRNFGGAPGGRGPRPGPQRSGGAKDEPGAWIWGWHAVEAVLRNPDRPVPEKLLATAERAKTIQTLRPGLKPEMVDNQVTDPQNVGAILRSAAAFGAKGVVMQDRHAPPLGGALAKAAAGALERTPVVRAVNLSRALEALSEAGWTSIGLDSEADSELDSNLNVPAVVIVLGSEGEGLRRLVAEHCDILAKIAMPGGFESLNVASAAAIALYAAVHRIGARVTGE